MPTLADSADPSLAPPLPPQPSALAAELLAAVREPHRYQVEQRHDGAVVVRYRTDQATGRTSEADALTDLQEAVAGLGYGADVWEDCRGLFVKLHATPWSLEDAFAQDDEPDAAEAVELAIAVGAL